MSCERTQSLPVDRNGTFVSNTTEFVVVFNILLNVIVFKRLHFVFVRH